MSPTEIPGEALKFITQAGNKKCTNPKCRREYKVAKITQNKAKGLVYKHCPYCNYKLGEYSIETLRRLAQKNTIYSRKSAK